MSNRLKLSDSSPSFYQDPRTGKYLKLDEGLERLLRTRELYTNMDWKGYGAFEDGQFDGEPTRDLGVADVAASQRVGSDKHAIMFDIDHKARIVQYPFGKHLEVVMDDGGGSGKKLWANEVLPDAPAWIIPTTTENHNHLYVDVDWPWDRVLYLMRDLVEVGVIEQGYYDASKNRGKTSLRLPWVRKGPGATSSSQTPVAF